MTRTNLLLRSRSPTHMPPGSPAGVRTASAHLRSAGRHGFTLVELLVAAAVLAVGLLALTSAGAAIVTLGGRGQALAQVAAAAENRLELLRIPGCVSGSGSSERRGFEEHWSALRTRPRTITVVDSIVQKVHGRAGHSGTHVFRSAVRC